MASNKTPLTVRGVLEQYKEQIAAALPQHLTAERMVRLALTETRRNYLLGQADPISLFGAVVQASQLGLEIGAGGAWLVPFRNKKKGIVEVQCIPDYRGLIKLARNSGEIGKFIARPVFDGDFFEYDFGTNERIEHKPRGETDPKKIVAVYAIAKSRDGSWEQFDVMLRPEIEAIRKRSKAGTDGPWVTDYGPMACKSVVKRLCKYLPQSPQLANALRLDDDAEIGRQNMRAVLDSEAVEEHEDERPAIAPPRRRGEAAPDDAQMTQGQEAAQQNAEQASDKPAGKKQLDAIRAMAASEDVSIAELCEAMQVETLEDLPASRVKEALAWLSTPAQAEGADEFSREMAEADAAAASGDV
jgi:recombination protein RecT